MENKIKDMFAEFPGEILEIKKGRYNIMVRFAHRYNTNTPLFWEVKEINFDKKEVVYLMRIENFELYTK